MADHWKILANRLGTPGIDEPEVDEITEESPASGTASSAAKPTYSEIPAYTDPASEPSKGVGAAWGMGPSGQTTSEPPAEASKVVEPPASAKPAKRRSSWEALANLFNVSVDRSEPETEVEPEEPKPQESKLESPQAESHPPEFKKPELMRSESQSPSQRSRSTAGSGPTKELSLFDEPKQDPNTALDAMFGDAPREKLRSEGAGWGKPKRVVDDLGWDEVDDQPIRDEEQSDDEDELDSGAAAETTRALEDGEEAGEEPARRSRRRRRRGRRGRGRDDEAGALEESLPEDAGDDEDSPDLPVSWKHDLIEVESAGPWAEPESFESDVYEAADEPSDELLEDDDSDDESDDGIEVVRRSSRRRRRRGRSRDESPAAEETATPRNVAPREAREPRGRDSESRREVRSERNEAPRDVQRGEAAPGRESVPRGDQPGRGSREGGTRESGSREGSARESGSRDSRDRGGRDRSGRDAVRDSGRDAGRDRDSGRDAGRRDAPRGAEPVERPRRDAGRPVEQSSPVDDFELDFVEPIDDLDDLDEITEERPSVTDRAAGGRRRRGGRKPVDSPERSRSAEDEDIEEVVDEGEDDDLASGANKHRNIPTWSDSLESIIQANTENHKRNEGRGGPRGGNRPRGRR